jgi:hypothetical protein
MKSVEAVGFFWPAVIGAGERFSDYHGVKQ